MPQGRSGGGRGGRGGGPGGMGMRSEGGPEEIHPPQTATISISGGTVVIHASGGRHGRKWFPDDFRRLVTIVGPTRGDTSILITTPPPPSRAEPSSEPAPPAWGQTFGDSEQAVVTHQIEESDCGNGDQHPGSGWQVLISTAPDQSFSMISFQQSGFDCRGNLSGDGWRDGF